ncbi:hypothetical protein FKM82_000014 [Ascaphus truei]
MKLLVFVVGIMTTVLEFPEGLPSHAAPCCTQLAKRIPQNMLQHVTRVQFQRSNGVCILQAVVLHVYNQVKCMDPKNRTLKKWLKKQLRPDAV